MIGIDFTKVTVGTQVNFTYNSKPRDGVVVEIVTDGSQLKDSRSLPYMKVDMVGGGTKNFTLRNITDFTFNN